MSFVTHEQQSLVWLASPLLGGVRHGFSTRRGGVSPAPWDTLNLGPGRGDAPENVEENYRRFFAALDMDSAYPVLSRQVHRDDVRLCTAADAGKGLIRDRDYDAAVITPAAKPVSPFCRPSDIAFFIKNTLAAPREVPKNGSRSPYNASIIHPFSSCVRNQYPCVQNTGFPHRCQIHFPTGWPFTNPENRCRSGQQGASLLCLTQGTGCRMAPFPLISGSF